MFCTGGVVESRFDPSLSYFQAAHSGRLVVSRGQGVHTGRFIDLSVGMALVSILFYQCVVTVKPHGLGRHGFRIHDSL